jgi:hypothetical protein
VLLEPGAGGDAIVDLVLLVSLDAMLQILERRPPLRQHLMKSALHILDSMLAGDEVRFLLRFDTLALVVTWSEFHG